MDFGFTQLNPSERYTIVDESGNHSIGGVLVNVLEQVEAKGAHRFENSEPGREG